MFLSADARSFAEPPAGWKPSRSRVQSKYEGSSQSLIGDLLRAGATGASGQVREPYLDGAVRPDILFPAYLAGLNLAESFYAAMPYLSWQTVVVGDPLCAPFRPETLTADSPDPALDPDTELPALFSARRLAAMERRYPKSDVLKLIVRAEARSARDDIAGATEMLTKAAGLDPTSIDAWRGLGFELERAQKYSEAAIAYRRVLELNRNDIVALNNLSYIMAVRENRPQDALPIATRAATLARGDPLVQDTLAWIHHLLGDNQEAVKLLSPAIRALPGHAELQFHAAVVFLAVGRLEEAAKAINAALALEPSLKERPDVIQLQGKLRRGALEKESE